MTVILARHGDASNSHGKFHGLKDEPLTSKGRSETYQLAKELKQYKATMIYYSPLKRNRDSAKILSSELGIPARAAPQLKPLDSGIFDGKSTEHHADDFRHYLQNPNEKIPGGQSVNDWAAQYLPFFEHYLNNKSDQTVIFVTHGRNIVLSKAYMRSSGVAPQFDKRVLVDNKTSTEHSGYALAHGNHFEIIDSKRVSTGMS
jgi:broad specificity phosphatase PhoE